MLLDFLSDAITNMESFRDDIGTAYLFEETPGKFVITGNHPKRFLFYRVAPDADLTSEIKAPAYMGALSYLSTVLSSSLMKENPRLELTYTEKEGKKLSVLSMRFLAKRFEAQFQCTSPSQIKESDRTKQFPRPPDAIFFPLNKVMRAEFNEVARAGTPKANIRLFTLGYDGKYVRATFGGGTHSTTILLSDEVTGATDIAAFSKQVSLDRFQTMLKIAASCENAKAAFHQSCTWVDFNTPQGLHTIATPTWRDQPR